MSFLSLISLEKRYADGTHAVRGVDLSADAGEFIVLLGPSGCGKTTTLRMIAGLEIPTAGTIALGGADVTRLRPSQRDVGFVFQFYALYPHLSVRENILFPLKAVGMPAADRKRALAQVSERLGIEPLLSRYPRQLSGGDQQRVSLARAMVRAPAIYLMDEPLGTLDAEVRLSMREFIREQQLAMQITTLYVTHDQEEAMSLADRVVVMKDGEISQIGSPLAIYDEPADLFVANFVGTPGMNFLTGNLMATDAGHVFRPTGLDDGGIAVTSTAPAGPATAGIRPEHVRPAADGPLRGEVVLDEYNGDHRIVHLQTAAGPLVYRAAADDRQQPGATLAVTLAPAHLCLFNSDTGARL
jgi:multiple sugar transport system ATP-binding protein